MKMNEEKIVIVDNGGKIGLGTEAEFETAAREIFKFTGGSSLGGAMSMLWGFLLDGDNAQLSAARANVIAKEAVEFREQFGKQISHRANELLSKIASLSAILPVERIKTIGFEKYGDWYLESGRLECKVAKDAYAKNVLYAFVSEGEVLYIGKTNQSLKKRLYGYMNPGSSQPTNKRGNTALKERLMNGESIEVYAFPDNGLLCYGEFHINLAAGLEDDLIAKLNPVWNINGTEFNRRQKEATS